MISKAKLRLVKSLQSKRIRQKQQLFLVQGEKAIGEILQSRYKIRTLFATEKFLERNPVSDFKLELVTVLPNELAEISTLETNDAALAVVAFPEEGPVQLMAGETGLMLDNIRDPGNLGTILRTADWFGVHKIVASHGTVDLYNPKVINASMGSFIRIELQYTDLEHYIDQHGDYVYYGTGMNYPDAHEVEFRKPAFLCLGNESNGISGEVQRRMSEMVTIPRRGAAESLNVAIATGILLNLATR